MDEIHAVGEMIRLARTRLVSAVLVGADKTDESLGMPDALIPPTRASVDWPGSPRSHHRQSRDGVATSRSTDESNGHQRGADASPEREPPQSYVANSRRRCRRPDRDPVRPLGNLANRRITATYWTLICTALRVRRNRARRGVTCRSRRSSL